MKTILRIVAVAFGGLLIGKSLYLEHLFHVDAFTGAYLPDVVEVLITWLVVLGGLTAYLVRRATPINVVTNHNHYHYQSESDDSDSDGDEESEED